MIGVKRHVKLSATSFSTENLWSFQYEEIRLFLKTPRRAQIWMSKWLASSSSVRCLTLIAAFTRSGKGQKQFIIIIGLDSLHFSFPLWLVTGRVCRSFLWPSFSSFKSTIYADDIFPKQDFLVIAHKPFLLLISLMIQLIILKEENVGSAIIFFSPIIM